MIVISGGQTGADQAGWRAAKACGIKTGGWMTPGYETEDGRRPEFAGQYGAKIWRLGGKAISGQYAARTKANAGWADATFWFNTGETDSTGFTCTQNACRVLRRPFTVVTKGFDSSRTLAKALCQLNNLVKPNKILDHLCTEFVINIAGSRESKSPGIGEYTEELLTEALQNFLLFS